MSAPRKAGLFLVFVTVFIDLLGFGIVMPLLPRYGRHFDAEGFPLGMLMASFSAMQFLFAPIWGRISDRIGRRPVLIVGLVGSTVSYALFGLATSLGREGTLLGLSALTWLFLTRIGAGIAGATISTAQAYIADCTGPKDRAKGMALIGAAFGIGFTFGPLIGAAFVSADPVVNLTSEQLRFVESYDFAEVPNVDTVVQEVREIAPLGNDDEALLRSAIEHDPTRINPVPSAAPGYVAAVLSGLALLFAVFRLPESLNPESKPASSHWLDVKQFQTLLKTRSVAVVLLGIFLSTLALAQFESSLSLLTQRLGVSPRYNFYVFAYIGLILTLSQGILVRRLVPKVGEYKMALIGAVLMTVGLALIGVAGDLGSTAFLYSVLPICVIGFSFIAPSLQSLLSRLVSNDQQGGVLGVGQSLSSLARILGPIAGLTIEKNFPTGPYWLGAVVMLAGGASFFSLKTEVQRLNASADTTSDEPTSSEAS
ncbi:MFS transporter [Thalassoglobus sp. JC818]|uniref:MFS transporter n=1 Tax=Thalassoglobus sp. JC818 TaxID=3232136 RepID=UPI00345B3309